MTKRNNFPGKFLLQMMAIYIVIFGLVALILLAAGR